MKRLSVIVLTILLLLLSGCSSSKLSDNQLSEELEDIPETLIVDAELPQNLPENASVYKVSFKKFDSEELLDYFHMETDSAGERNAFGLQFESGDSLLYIFDDDGAMPGGFSYLKSLSDLSAASTIMDVSADTDFMRDHAVDDFLYPEALSFLETFGLHQGLGQLKVDRAYAFSGEALNTFIGSSDEFTEPDSGAFAPEAQYSCVYLAQYIDDIPFMTSPWGVSGKTQTYSEAEVLISENQAIDIIFNQLYDVGKEISNDKIISAEMALNAFIADYNKKMQFDTTTITDISLNYVVTIDKDGMYAQPAYVFEYEYQAKTENASEFITIEENKVISALNGTCILSTEVGI